MTNQDAIRWLDNLKNDIGNPHYEGLWHYAQAIDEICCMLEEQAKTKVVFGRTKDGEFVTECGNCGTHLDKAYSNCPKCKKELDWNSNQT